MADIPRDNALFRWYERYVGEPDATTDVYLGFGVFFCAVALGIVGLVLFLVSGTAAPGSDRYWAFRRIAIVLTSLGLPAALVGIVILLPVDRRALYAASGGTFLCLAAMGLFVSVYPNNWNVQTGTDYSTLGVAIYATGLAVVVAATGAALVAHQLERVRPVPDEDGDGDGREESVSEERVARDIEDAMADVELSWGGVRRKETKRLEVEIDDEGIDSSSFDRVGPTETSSEGVEDAVAGLRALQGRDRDTATGSGADDQAAALAELRERQRAEALARADETLLDRLRDRVRTLLARERQ